MNKSELKLKEAIQKHEYLNHANTLVQPTGIVLKVLFHGSLIAEYNYKTKKLILSDRGYCTRTTVSRLNMILQAFNLKAIRARRRNSITEFVYENFVFATHQAELNHLTLK